MLDNAGFFRKFRRFAADVVGTALSDTPVVMVTGPRQCGKTTLVQGFAGTHRYVTLDDDTTFLAAQKDAGGFVRGLDRAIVDEVQRVPALLRAIKKSVDIDRRPGRFLLTGSANVLTLPMVSESLAGRMQVVDLLPLAQAEIRGTRSSFLEKAFQSKLVKPGPPVVGTDLVDTVLSGGYPEVLRRTTPVRRRAWAKNYMNAMMLRDVRDISTVDKLGQMPRLVQALALHAGQLTNFTHLGGLINMDDKTTRKYIATLEQLFLVVLLEPWFRNPLNRLVKTPKLHYVDSGLLAAVLGTNAERIARDRSCFGPLLETFVFGEIAKQRTWLDEGCELFHYRDKDKNEVDIVVESDSRAVVGIEVKASATVTPQDFRGLRKLAAGCGKDFKLGVVFYDAEDVVPFGNNMYAAPVSCLWA
jgi:predicted AAA+ superfamily ATPase